MVLDSHAWFGRAVPCLPQAAREPPGESRRGRGSGVTGNWPLFWRGLAVAIATWVMLWLSERYAPAFRRYMARRKAEQVEREMTLPASWGAEAWPGDRRARLIAALRPEPSGGRPLWERSNALTGKWSKNRWGS